MTLCCSNVDDPGFVGLIGADVDVLSFVRPPVEVGLGRAVPSEMPITTHSLARGPAHEQGCPLDTRTSLTSLLGPHQLFELFLRLTVGVQAVEAFCDLSH